MLPSKSEQDTQQALLYFAIHYLITAIRIGSDLLYDYQRVKQLSPGRLVGELC